jgi:hypothetical protein
MSKVDYNKFSEIVDVKFFVGWRIDGIEFHYSKFFI